jgi:hypothetical protein
MSSHKRLHCSFWGTRLACVPFEGLNFMKRCWNIFVSRHFLLCSHDCIGRNTIQKFEQCICNVWVAILHPLHECSGNPIRICMILNGIHHLIRTIGVYDTKWWCSLKRVYKVKWPLSRLNPCGCRFGRCCLGPPSVLHQSLAMFTFSAPLQSHQSPQRCKF